MKKIVLCCILLTAGCAGEVGQRHAAATGPDVKLGQSVRQNIAVQIANPDAPPSHPLQTSGARAAGAQERYQTDKVEKPESTSTVTGLSQGQSE